MNVEDQLADFCRQLPSLRAAARRNGLSTELTAVLAEVHAGTPVAELLPRLGIPPDGLRSGTYQVLPRVTGHPTGEVHVCPWDACGRSVRREPGGPVPDERCWVVDQPLRRVRR